MPRAAVFEAAGTPQAITEFTVPELRRGEVLIRVACCALCRSDLHTHAGRRIEPTPTVLGHEIVGRIAAFGHDAPRSDAAGCPLEIGDRVTWAIAVGCGECFFCHEDVPQKCNRPYKYGHARLDPVRPLGGGLADAVLLVPGTVCFRVPDTIPDAVAATANCATATAGALVRAGGSVSGRTVLVLGGGVLGLTAAAMARAGGAVAVVVADPVAASRERALRFGATHAVTTDGCELTDTIAALTQGRGADLVLEAAGAAAAVEAAFAQVRTAGTLVLAGTVAPVGTMAFDPERVVRRMLTIRGVHNYHPRDLAFALAFLAGTGRGLPWAELVAAEYPLEDVERAFAQAHGEPGKRVLVRPGNRERE